MDAATRELGRRIVDEAIQLQEENARLREFVTWVIEQRWNEDADLDDICIRAEKVRGNQ